MLNKYNKDVSMYKFICSVCKDIECSDEVVPDNLVVDENKPNRTLEELEASRVMICSKCNTGAPSYEGKVYRQPTDMEYAIASFSNFNAVDRHDQAPQILEEVDGVFNLNQLGIALYNTMYNNAKEKQLEKVNIKSHPLYQKILAGFDITVDDVLGFDLNDEELYRVTMLDVNMKTGNLDTTSNIRMMTEAEEKRVKRDKRREQESADKRDRNREKRKKNKRIGKR